MEEKSREGILWCVTFVKLINLLKLYFITLKTVMVQNSTHK